jgi:hypothetical protein
VAGQQMMSGFLGSLRHLVMGLTLTALLVPASADGPGPWHTDYAKALAEARRSGKPLFVVFTCRH